jgi:hypothetical protein
VKRSSLVEAVSNAEILHARFKTIFEEVAGHIRHALEGDEPKFSMVAGPSRVGKTALLRALERAFPSTRRAGVVQRRVLFATSPDAPSPQLLPGCVLKGLGIKAPSSLRRTTDLTDFMHEQLDLADNVVLVFDEIGQLVEPGSRIQPGEAARWFKNVVMRGRSVVTAGVPRIERLLEADVQLKGRSYRLIRWDPYRASVAEDLRAYLSTAKELLALFNDRGWTVDVNDRAILANCYLHAPGLCGGLSDLMKELAQQRRGQKPEPLTLAHFAAASRALECLGPGNPIPFGSATVTFEDMNKAHLHVLELNKRGPARKV